MSNYTGWVIAATAARNKQLADLAAKMEISTGELEGLRAEIDAAQSKFEQLRTEIHAGSEWLRNCIEEIVDDSD